MKGQRTRTLSRGPWGVAGPASDTLSIACGSALDSSIVYSSGTPRVLPVDSEHQVNKILPNTG